MIRWNDNYITGIEKLDMNISSYSKWPIRF